MKTSLYFLIKIGMLPLKWQMSDAGGWILEEEVSLCPCKHPLVFHFYHLQYTDPTEAQATLAKVVLYRQYLSFVFV